MEFDLRLAVVGSWETWFQNGEEEGGVAELAMVA